MTQLPSLPPAAREAIEAILSNERDDAPLRSLTVSEMNGLRKALHAALAPIFPANVPQDLLSLKRYTPTNEEGYMEECATGQYVDIDDVVAMLNRRHSVAPQDTTAKGEELDLEVGETTSGKIVFIMHTGSVGSQRIIVKKDQAERVMENLRRVLHLTPAPVAPKDWMHHLAEALTKFYVGDVVTPAEVLEIIARHAPSSTEDARKNGKYYRIEEREMEFPCWLHYEGDQWHHIDDENADEFGRGKPTKGYWAPNSPEMPKITLRAPWEFVPLSTEDDKAILQFLACNPPVCRAYAEEWDRTPFDKLAPHLRNFALAAMSRTNETEGKG